MSAGHLFTTTNRKKVRFRFSAFILALILLPCPARAGGGEVYDIEWEENLPVAAAAASLEIPANYSKSEKIKDMDRALRSSACGMVGGGKC